MELIPNVKNCKIIIGVEMREHMDKLPTASVNGELI